MPWTRVSPEDFVLRFCVEEGVSDAKGLKGTQYSLSSRWPFQFIIPTPKGPRREGHESLSAPTLALKWSRRTSCSRAGDGQDCCCKILVELIFCVRSGGQYWGVHTDQGKWAFGGVQASVHQPTAYSLERTLQLRHSHQRRHNTGGSSYRLWVIAQLA